MSAGTTRVLLISGSLALCVLLFIAPRTAPSTPEKTGGEKAGSTIEAMDMYRRLALKTLAADEAESVDRLSKSRSHDSLVSFWLEKRRPDLAALAAEEKALATKEPTDFFEAGNRYYNAVRFTRDETEIPALFQSAIRCFSEGLSKEPGNTDAKIMLASCYVEGGNDPMKGIALLREVEKTDSNNVKLQLSFAFFSVESGQLDKAEQRFRKVLAIDSNYIEAWLHLADLYQRKGENDSTIRMLSEYAVKTNDPTARMEVNKYINQLKNKATTK